MKRITLTLLALIVAVVSLGASKAQAADRFALVRVVNTSTIDLSFHVQLANGPWQHIRLRPGEWRGISAGFTAPGSYVHAPIRIGFDEDLRWGQDRWRTFMPYVQYSPDNDFNRAQLYHFGFDGSTGQFVEMFKAN